PTPVVAALPAPAPAAPPPAVERPASAPALKAPAPPVPPAPPAPRNDLKVRDAVLAVVAEKTGYPSEMLDLDMGFDADLGIDSIKRVEILSALQERLPEAPAVKPEHLGVLHTLRDVADFLAGGEQGDDREEAVST